MLIRFGLLILFLSCVKTTENIHDDIGVSDYNRRFSLWPSMHNAARLMRVRREDTQSHPAVISEGDPHGEPSAPSVTTPAPQQSENNNNTNSGQLKDQVTSQGSNHTQNAIPSLNNGQSGPDGIKPGPSDPNSGAANTKSEPNDSKPKLNDTKSTLSDDKSGSSNGNVGPNDNKDGSNNTKAGPNDAKSEASNATAVLLNAGISNSTIQHVVNTTDNSTDTVKTGQSFDLKDPGVVKRGLIVFGGFALMAVAYYIFYRRKGKNNPSGNMHSLTDTNPYAVLESEDQRDTELSRVPLTMESDEEEEEDLEIFDLGQKKQSLSYVNLQTNDEDVVFSLNDHEEDDRDNLLIDIEDGASDTLINWSSSGNNKSIL